MPSAEPTGVEIGDIPSWIALALSLGSLGWQFVTEQRSSRKEKMDLKLSRISTLEKSLTEIRALAMAYWLHPESAVAKDGLMLTHHLRQLSRDTSTYIDLLWPEAQRDVISLKMQTTGSSFQQANRPVYPANHEFVRKFMATSATFAERLQDVRDSIEES